MRTTRRKRRVVRLIGDRRSGRRECQRLLLVVGRSFRDPAGL